MKDKRWLKAAWFLVVLVCPLAGWSQGLTEEQYAKLKTDITITNQAEFSAMVAANDDAAIAEAYNVVAAPAFWVWKSAVFEQEIYESTSPDAAAPTWSWSTFKAQTVQERESWAVMVRPGKINPSLKQTRDGFGVIFGGQGASAVQNAYLLAISRRPARRIEVLLKVLGDGSAAVPANMGYEGTLTSRDVGHALRGIPLS